MCACTLLVHEECIALLFVNFSRTPMPSPHPCYLLCELCFFDFCFLFFPPPLTISISHPCQSFFYFFIYCFFLTLSAHPSQSSPCQFASHSSLSIIPVTSSQSVIQPASHQKHASFILIPFAHPQFSLLSSLFHFSTPTVLLPKSSLRALFLCPLPHVPFLSPTVQLFLPHLISSSSV